MYEGLIIQVALSTAGNFKSRIKITCKKEKIKMLEGNI